MESPVDSVFAWLGVVVLGSFFPFFSRSPFFGGEARVEWGIFAMFAITGARLVRKGYYLGRASSSCGSGCSCADAEQMRLEIGSRIRWCMADSWGWAEKSGSGISKAKHSTAQHSTAPHRTAPHSIITLLRSD